MNTSALSRGTRTPPRTTKASLAGGVVGPGGVDAAASGVPPVPRGPSRPTDPGRASDPAGGGAPPAAASVSVEGGAPPPGGTGVPDGGVGDGSGEVTGLRPCAWSPHAATSDQSIPSVASTRLPIAGLVSPINRFHQTRRPLPPSQDGHGGEGVRVTGAALVAQRPRRAAASRL